MGRLTSAAAHTEAVGPRGTLVTAPANHVGFTTALTSHYVTLTAEGALRVTLTGWIQQIWINGIHERKCLSFKTVLSLNGFVILVFLCLLTQGAVVNNGRNTADEFRAHLSQCRHRSDHKGIKTHVADHLLLTLLWLWCVTLKPRKLCVFRDQYQLLGEKRQLWDSYINECKQEW